MLNKTMLSMEEVQLLVDLKMGYGTDSYSQKVFATLDKKDKRLHLVPSKAMRRYIRGFIKRKFYEKYNKYPDTNEEEDEILKIEGSTKGQVYEKKGILLMLEDEKVKELILDRLGENTYLFPNHKGEQIIIPDFVREYYFKETYGRYENVEKAEYHIEIKEDSTDTLKLKLSVIQREIEFREEFKKMITEYDEVAESRSPESLYYYETE